MEQDQNLLGNVYVEGRRAMSSTGHGTGLVDVEYLSCEYPCIYVISRRIYMHSYKKEYLRMCALHCDKR